MDGSHVFEIQFGESCSLHLPAASMANAQYVGSPFTNLTGALPSSDGSRTVKLRKFNAQLGA